MNPIEHLRSKVINDLFTQTSFSGPFSDWQKLIAKTLTDKCGGNEIIALGNNLESIFKSTSQGRSQSSVSGGGNAWEALVCWYLNLALLGSRTVVIKSKKENVPESLSKAISVVYQGSFKSNTESDLLAVTLPESLKGHYEYQTHDSLMQHINNTILDEFSDTELTIIQCKTNWNDNAQIPMLWDLIYSANGFNRNVHVGTSGLNPNKLANFNYAFVTVPTSRGPFKPTSTAVMRVRNLTGGNYWGKPTEAAVAANIFEIIQRNFSTSFDSYDRGWFSQIPALIKAMKDEENVFRLQ